MPDPQSEVFIDANLVRDLLATAEDPAIAALARESITLLANGWDNHSFLLGSDHLARLPHRQVAVPLIELEQRWLPEVCADKQFRCGLPVPRYCGQPGPLFKWPWSVVDFYDGVPVGQAVEAGVSEAEADRLGSDLADFMARFQSPASAEAPISPYRGMPLAERYDNTARAIAELEPFFAADDLDVLARVWEQTSAAAPFAGPPLWIHGDLHPWNMVWYRDRLRAVIDFGDMTPGDPATDLSIGWWVFDHRQRRRFFDQAATAGVDLDQATLTRAHGWALSLTAMVGAGATVGSGLHRAALVTLGRIIDEARSDRTPNR